jgi:hypothetical protein
MHKVLQGIEFGLILLSFTRTYGREVTHYMSWVPHHQRAEELWVEVEDRVSSLGGKDGCS